MQPVTKEDLQRCFERGRTDYLNVLAAGWPQIEAAGITTPLRWCHFVSQWAHETDGFSIVRENTHWTPAQMKALWPARFPLGGADPRIMACRGDPEKLANLAYASVNGNQGGDDGWRYRGGSMPQLTGRENYAACGAAIGISLEDEPERIEEAAVGLAAAIWEWGLHDNNALADHNYGRAIGNAINRGNPYSAHEPIGYASRRQWFDRAWALWGEGELPDDSILYLGAYGPQVFRVQSKLKELGYGVGTVDGVLGPTTARALAGFKLDGRRQGLDMEPDERVGPLTISALGTAGPAPISPDRTHATVATLISAGSTEVATGQKAKGLGQIALYTGAAGGLDAAGALDQLAKVLAGITGVHTALVPAIGAVQWGLKNALWASVMIGGVWMWVRGRDVVLARLAAHQSGANLGR
jgi:putative chitinase